MRSHLAEVDDRMNIIMRTKALKYILVDPISCHFMIQWINKTSKRSDFMQHYMPRNLWNCIFWESSIAIWRHLRFELKSSNLTFAARHRGRTWPTAPAALCVLPAHVLLHSPTESWPSARGPLARKWWAVGRDWAVAQCRSPTVICITPTRPPTIALRRPNRVILLSTRTAMDMG